MSEVIQPAPGQTVITTDHDRHRHHDGHHQHHDGRFDAVEARADFRSLTNEVERFGTLNGDRVKDGFSIAGDRITAVGSAGQLAACRTDSLVQSGFGGVSREICESTKDITGALGTGFTAAALAACKTADEVAAVYASLQKQVSDAATATVVGFKDAQATAYQIEGRTALDAAKNVAAIGLQATGNFNLLTIQGTENTYKVLLDSQKNASAAQLEAQKNAAALAAQIAECCCELRTQAAANLASITATTTAGFTAVTGKMDQTTIDELRAFKASIPRGIPVTVPVTG